MIRRPSMHALVLYALLIGLALPFLPLILWSVAAAWRWPALLPEVWSLQAWEYLLAPTTRVLPALGESVLLAAGVTGAALLIGLPAGRALGQQQFPGKTLVEALILLPILTPAFASAMGLHAAWIRYGLADTRLGVGLVHLIPTAPYMVRALAAAFATQGTRLEEQARTLGAAPAQVFFHVTLPRLLPAMVAGSIFVFLGSLGQYLLTLLIGGGRVQTLPVVLYPLMTSGDRSMAAAGSLILVMPAILVIWSLDRTVRQIYRTRDSSGD